MNEPLGTLPNPPSLGARRGRALSISAWVAALAALAAGGFTLSRHPLTAGEPVAVAKIEEAAPAPAPISAPAPVAAAPLLTGPQITTATASDVEASSGVKVVRNGGGNAGGALIIDVSQSLGVRLTAAPDKRLVEKTRFGLLPRLGADGARPSDVYARPVMEPARLKGSPRVAILVGGVGIDADSTNIAISRLPGPISLALAPYGVEIERQAAHAREVGHEIWLQAPMEGLGVSASPGPHTLTTAVSETENRESLQWLMGRFVGYVGVTNYLGGKFTADSRAFSPVLSELTSRGLYFLDDGSSPRSLAKDIAPTLNLPETAADVVLDSAPTPAAIDAALARLEAIARRQGTAIGVATALPVSIERIARFAANLEARGISLIPVSALISRAPSASARANP